MVIKHAVTCADDGLAVSSRIPRQAEPRGHVVVITRNAFDDSEGFLRSGIHRCGRFEQGTNLYVVAHAVIHGEMTIDSPTVLREEAHGLVIEGIVGGADSLDISGRNSEAVRLQSGCA